MAITEQGLAAVKTYFGLSTDSKPTTGVDVGSFFIETDTVKKFVYTGSAWVEIGTITATL